MTVLSGAATVGDPGDADGDGMFIPGIFIPGMSACGFAPDVAAGAAGMFISGMFIPGVCMCGDGLGAASGDVGVTGIGIPGMSVFGGCLCLRERPARCGMCIPGMFIPGILMPLMLPIWCFLVARRRFFGTVRLLRACFVDARPFFGRVLDMFIPGIFMPCISWPLCCENTLSLIANGTTRTTNKNTCL